MNVSLISSLAEETNAPFRLVRSGGNSIMKLQVKYPGMDAVVQFIKKMIEVYRGSEDIRNAALEITSSISVDSRTGNPDRRNYDAIADAIYDYIKYEIDYVRDQNGIERLQTPDATLLLGTGDCDDMVILAGSMLESLGVPTRMKLLGKEREFTHILIEYLSNGEWKSFDPTLALYPGYNIPEQSYKANKVVPIDRSAKIKKMNRTRKIKKASGSHYIYN
jgi:transglutaminase-like putative cysteine protease